MLGTSVKNPLFTYGDYLHWSGDERWELIRGEAFSMSPSPSRSHQDVVVGLLAQIADDVRQAGCRVYVAPFDVRLPEAQEDDMDVSTVVQPDLAVICDETKLDDAGCRGAPDWIVEVISPSTAARDRVQKRDLYEHHGVLEYWIVDPIGHTWIRYSLEPSSRRFDNPREERAAGRAHSAILPEITVDWDQVFEA